MNRGALLRSPVFWLLLGIFAAEFLLFDQFGSRRVTGFFPRWNDQIQYLSECYTGFEYARTHGFLPGVWHALVNPSAQGTLHDVAGVVVFQFAGASRSAALSINILALIAWQCALFLVVRRNGSDWLALTAALLPLTLNRPWEDAPGSAYDFRLDHLAMCAIGVTSCAALATDGLRSRSCSILLGAAVGLTLLTRFLTGTYFVIVFVGLLAWVLAGENRRSRVCNGGLAAAIAAVIAGPLFWINREWVWNYYYIGHYVGPESAIRNQNFGIGPSLEYIWGWFTKNQLGAFFGVFAAAITIVLAFVSWRRGGASTAEKRHISQKGIVLTGTIFLLAPALVLTLHPQKSEIVLGALVPGAILLITGLWLVLSRRGPARSTNSVDAPAWIATAAAAAGLIYFGQRQTTAFRSPEAMANLRQVNMLADYVAQKADAARLASTRVAVDHITDALDAQVLRVICYERQHVWRNFDMKLPTGIAEPETEDVRRRLAESDFVFLFADEGPHGPFPYDRKLAALRPELRTWCEANLRLAKTFSLSGRPVVLYQRHEIPFP